MQADWDQLVEQRLQEFLDEFVGDALRERNAPPLPEDDNEEESEASEGEDGGTEKPRRSKRGRGELAETDTDLQKQRDQVVEEKNALQAKVEELTKLLAVSREAGNSEPVQKEDDRKDKKQKLSDAQGSGGDGQSIGPPGVPPLVHQPAYPQQQQAFGWQQQQQIGSPLSFANINFSQVPHVMPVHHPPVFNQYLGSPSLTTYGMPQPAAAAVDVEAKMRAYKAKFLRTIRDNIQQQALLSTLENI